MIFLENLKHHILHVKEHAFGIVVCETFHKTPEHIHNQRVTFEI
jgi:hypothetical protein